jgi:hypothetical protein
MNAHKTRKPVSIDWTPPGSFAAGAVGIFFTVRSIRSIETQLILG